ncbi:golgin subfamily A member 5 [Trichonephila clavipes]|nr:golgin subfamily A member 5 [Trichonephila clavipes]
MPPSWLCALNQIPNFHNVEKRTSIKDNSHPHTIVVTLHALQSVLMLPWPAKSPDRSPIECVWDIIGSQLQHHPLPALTVPVLTNKHGSQHH